MENFVKIDGITYYESQLRLMNEKQLNDLIKKCQKGIDEVEMKKQDYQNCNYDTANLDHYYEVINKFQAASVYLQSDIVLISRILKNKSNTVSICDKNDWYQEFFHTAARGLPRFLMQKLMKKTNSAVGYEIKHGE